MLNEQTKILELLAKATDEAKVENLLNAFIHDATFEDVAQIRALLNEQLMWEKTPRISGNYRKALEFLD